MKLYINEIIFFFSVYILITVALIGIGIVTFKSSSERQTFEISANCNGTNMFNTAACLNNELSSWWKYNISNKDLYWNNLKGMDSIVNWTYIKENGGVCWHAAKWYDEQIKAQGIFNATYVEVPLGEVQHTYIVISSSEGYCTLDQNSEPRCAHSVTNKGGKNETS